jgi:aminopeptidase
MRDERLTRYAELLVDTCLGVQPGWQVVLYGTPQGRPLVEELARVLARREAYALLRVTFGGNAAGPRQWVAEAPLALLQAPAPLELHTLLHADALIVVDAPENTRDQTAVAPERLQASQEGIAPVIERITNHEMPWVGCQYPTPALAQDAGMSTDAFADFLFGACLLDWDAERERMRRHADRFDAASEVRLVGAETDLTLSVEGRSMLVDAGGANIPGGEFFCSPVEDSATGTIAFTEFPAVYQGRELQGIRLRFEGGRVVDASAETNEAFLHETLDVDDGARRIGELGIGCNPGITRYMRNTLFDEKIDGTAHVALGKGFPNLGGSNESVLHWDIVKDLRLPGSRIELDGEVVQRDGVWLPAE